MLFFLGPSTTFVAGFYPLICSWLLQSCSLEHNFTDKYSILIFFQWVQGRCQWSCYNFAAFKYYGFHPWFLRIWPFWWGACYSGVEWSKSEWLKAGSLRKYFKETIKSDFVGCINISLFLKTCIFISTSSPSSFFIITCVESWTRRKIGFLFCRSYNWHNNASLCCFILLVCFSLFSFEYRSALDKTPHLICIVFHLAYTRSWSCMVVISDLRHFLLPYILLFGFQKDDLRAVVDHLRADGNVSLIGLWGRSMGAVTRFASYTWFFPLCWLLKNVGRRSIFSTVWWSFLWQLCLAV